MMKNLLVLVLVLGLATAANATLSLSINGEPAPEPPDVYGPVPVSTQLVIDITSDVTTSYGAYLVLENLDLTEYVTDMGILAAAGQDASVTDYTADYPGWWYAEALSFNPDAPIIEGTHFEITIHCLAEGEATIKLLDLDEETVLDSTTILIPEPITIALLGVGGLFLRRRK